MSQPQNPRGGPGGSVKRARELMEAGLPPGMPPPSQSFPRQRTPDAERNASPAQSRLRQPMPAALSASRGTGPGIGVAISRPTQVPQWPLPVSQSNMPQINIDQSQASRGPTPQRPPRPRNVPSMLDASRLQEHTPAFQYRPQAEDVLLRPPQSREHDDNPNSPNLPSPLTPASRPSTISSVGSIPDFPLPMPAPSHQAGLLESPGPARRSANLGPPPSSRRGASSYYSNLSYVSPIPEESPRMQVSHGSYASSSAMPSGWRDDSSDYYYNDDESMDRNVFPEEPVPEEGRESRESNGDDNEERGLVRSASVGRRGKPSVVTTKSIDKLPAAVKPAPVASNNKLAKMGVFGQMEMRAAEMKAAAAAHANTTGGRPGPKPVQGLQDQSWPMVGNVNSPLASGTGFIDTSSSENSVPRAVSASKEVLPARTYSPGSVDPRISQILAAHKAAVGEQPENTAEVERSFSPMSAIRRPPKLNIDAVREAESRGSLTSLPDLIKRATKLAAMIDKGKRPGSRMNDLNDFSSSDIDLAREKEEGARSANRQSGLSGMLAAFPPPGLATPRDNSPRPGSAWPSPYGPSTDALHPKSRPEESKPGRRCCGLPLWAFLFITFTTIFIVAAAVLVPLFLLVLNKHSTTTDAQSALAQCQQTTTCSNGGTVILASNVCACICANGFTGSTCTVQSTRGCTTTNISGTNNTSYTNVTLGEAIPRLILQARSNFSIPLSSDLILARFSAANLSCDAENALVTFDGMNRRVGSASSPASSVSPSPTDAPAHIRIRYDGSGEGIPISTETSFSTATSNPSSPSSVNSGIAVDTSLPPNPSNSSPGSSPSATSNATSPASDGPLIITQETLDFARVAVLYILQQGSLDDAVAAQSAVQRFLSGVTGSIPAGQQQEPLSVAEGVTVDFRTGFVVVGGVTVGGYVSEDGSGSGSGSKRWVFGNS